MQIDRGGDFSFSSFSFIEDGKGKLFFVCFVFGRAEPEVQEFKRFKMFKGSRVQGFKGSRVLTFANAWTIAARAFRVWRCLLESMERVRKSY